MDKLKYLLFLLISIPVFAQSGQVSNIALQNASGYAQVKPGTNVYVCAYNSGLTCVTPTNEISIYANPSLSGGPIGQPLIADQSGRYNYFLPSGIEGVEKDCYTAGQCVTYPVWGGTAAGSGSFTYPPAGIPDSSGISWNSSFGIIGTDTSILTAGTVAGGAGTSVCLDVNGGLTTTGCSSISGTIGVIPVFVTSNSIGDSPLDTTSLGNTVSDSQNFRLKALGTATSSQNFNSTDLIVDASGWNTGLILSNNCSSCSAYAMSQVYTATISGETCSVNPTAKAIGAASGQLLVALDNPGFNCTVPGIITITGSPGSGYVGTLTVANAPQTDRWTLVDLYSGSSAPFLNSLTLLTPGHRSSSGMFEFCFESQPLQGLQSAHCINYDGQTGGQLNESISEITAARVASWVNASGDIALFTHGSPVNGDCVEFSVTGGVATLADNGAPCGSGSGAVNSVANSDGTLVISPTTGSVVASLNLAHANTWTGLQTLVGTDITGLPLSTGVTGTLSATNGGTGEAGTLTGILYGNATSAHTVASAAQLGTLFNSYISTLTGCSTANFVYTPAGNDCVAVSSGSGTVNSGTGGQITWYATTGTAVSGNANATLDSSGDATFGGTVTIGGTGTTHGLSVTEGTAWTPVTGQDILEAISSNHRFEMSLNGAAALLIPGIASAGTANDCLKLASNGIDIVDTGAACASGSVSFSAITSGTSTTGLTMGSSGVLSFSGTGIINANEINAVLLSTLATGPICNTTSTGVPFVCAASNIPSLVPYDTLYSAVTWTTLGAFTNNGATESIIAAGTANCPAGSNACIQFTGGANTYTQTLDFTYQSQLPIWTVEGTYVVGTPGSSTFGLGFGTRTNVSTGAPDQAVDIRMDASNTGTAGNVYLENGPSRTVLAQSTAPITFSAADKIHSYLTRVYDVISGFVEDQTTGQIVNLSYTYTPQPAGTGQTPPNIGTYSIYSFGGTQTLTSLKISTGTAKGADVVCIGDSKSVPIGSTNYAGGWCNLLQSGGYRALTLAGSGDLTASIVAEVPEIIALAPKNAVLMIGGNDVRSSVSSGTYEANISSIVSSLTAAGINVYVSTYPVENSGVNMTTLNTFITSTFPTSFIDINNSFPQTGSGVPTTWLYTDTVHPAQPFHTYIAQSILTRLQHDAIGQQFPYYHSTSGTQTIASGALALATSSIASGACQTVSAGSVNSASAPGVASTDSINWAPNVSLQTVSGYAVATIGALSLDDYPTAGFVNFNVCNWTTSSITPGALTLNWRVVR